MTRYRKRPVSVDAFHWTGNVIELAAFVGSQNWTRADARDVPWEHEDDEQVVIWNEIEKTWIPAPVGWWIVRGVQGEYYPVQPDIFEATYEPDISTSAPWNRVTLGNGEEAILLPALACINRIREPDGRLSCNHGDETPCDRTGHETIGTYEVVKRGDPRWWDAESSNPDGTDADVSVRNETTKGGR